MALRAVLPLLALTATAAIGQRPLAYQNLRPGSRLAEFARDVNRLAARDSLRCRTSTRTADLMECGAVVRDGDRRPYISAFVIAGRIAMISVIDSGGPALVDDWRSRLRSTYGDARPTGRGMVEWVATSTVARFTWRGRGDQRWISLTLTHEPTLAEIDRYLSGGSDPPRDD